jgi:predicted Zn-dependent protease
MGDPEKAKTAFRNELADNPNDFDANLYIGVLLKRDRMLDEASGYLSRAIRLRPRDYYARYHMGALYTTLGKPGEARVLLEGVAKEYPEFIEARVLLAKVYYRLNRKADGDREQAAVQKLTSEKQSKQPGVQTDPTRTELGKPPAEMQGPKPRPL